MGRKKVVSGEKRYSIRMFFGEYGRCDYSCADNIKVNRKNMKGLEIPVLS
jgi:hypothetical protein